MNKVAVITLVDFSNYGNRLQNYAVHKILEEIGYYPETWYVGKHHTILRVAKRIMYSFFVPRTIKQKRAREFRKFSFKYLHMKMVNTFSLNQTLLSRYQYFVFGSDQIWNPNFDLNYDTRFLECVEAKKKVCIAPSFGVDYISEDQLPKFKKGLGTFNTFSVREEQGKKIIKELTGKDAFVMLDPTLLYGDGWRSVVSSVSRDREWIVSFFIDGKSIETQKKMENWSKRYSCDILDFYDESDKMYCSDPFELLSYIAGAKVICTDSYHVTIFSFIFNKPVVIFDRLEKQQSMNSRFETLISVLGLQDRKAKNLRDENILLYDYASGKKNIDKARHKAMEFICKEMVRQNSEEKRK